MDSDAIPAGQRGDDCELCRHPNHERVQCMKCILALVQDVPPEHEYRPIADPRRTYLATSGRVYSPAAGSRVVVHGFTHSVHPPCDNNGDGLWLCVTHNVTTATNALKDYHCYHPGAFPDAKDAQHLLLWHCYAHGGPNGPVHLERAGPAEWMGDDRSPRLANAPSSRTVRLTDFGDELN